MKIRLISIFFLIFLLVLSFNSCSFAIQKDIKGPLPSFFQKDESSYIKFEDKNPNDVYVLNARINQTGNSSAEDNKVYNKTPSTGSETVKNLTLSSNSTSKELQNDNLLYVNQSPKASVNSDIDNKTSQSNLDPKTPVTTAAKNNNSASNDSSLLLTNTSERLQPGSESPNIMGYLIRFFAFLVLLVLVPLLIIRKLRGKLKVDYSIPKSLNGFVRIVDRVSLSYSELFIIEVMDKYLLLSLSKDGEIRLLKEFDTLGIIPEKENYDKKLVKSSFLDILRKFRQEVKQLNKN
ncbi:hypothetical protein TDSAC_0015 [Thermodesulfobium acidiphilum]|uniref:Flagellar protein n=1 Tax=Thermodesulfobium acidiphilum TaxID=1794699 RepID=A0A2R4VY14_THEAF|nr:flagellar biosynthetic protein FliO [Thermodesulfobium acidiphilum]AWB09405.1 hypothetical protein TDSAC_0015 [Thermodesulfobium acidiphilum]